MSEAARQSNEAGGRRRYTVFFVTINTNHKAKTAAEEVHLKQRLGRFMRAEFATMSTWNELLTISNTVVTNVHITAGVERAPKPGFIHAHAHVTIEHNGKVALKKPGAQANLQRIVTRALRINGAYAHITLGDSRVLNYVNKEGNAYSAGIQPTVSFDD